MRKGLWIGPSRCPEKHASHVRLRRLLHLLLLPEPALNGTVKFDWPKWFLTTIAHSAVDILAVGTVVDIQVDESRGESVALKGLRYLGVSGVDLLKHCMKVGLGS